MMMIHTNSEAKGPYDERYWLTLYHKCYQAVQHGSAPKIIYGER
jgi:hypothetical protein